MISDLKQRIAAKLSLSVAPELIFNGRLLQDTSLLGDCEIVEGSTIYIPWNIVGDVNGTVTAPVPRLKPSNKKHPRIVREGGSSWGAWGTAP